MHCHLSLQNRPPPPRATVTGFLVKQLQTSLASPCLRWLKTKSSSCWKNLTHILCRDPHKNKRCSLLDFKARICLKGYFSAETTAAERRSAWDRSSKGWWEWEIWGRRKGSCWVSKERRLWLLSTTTALHMWLKGKASQRPWQTQQPKATENTGWFQRQSWEENHSIQTGIFPVNYSWTKMLKTSLYAIQAFRRQCRPRGK